MLTFISTVAACPECSQHFLFIFQYFQQQKLFISLSVSMSSCKYSNIICVLIPFNNLSCSSFERFLKIQTQWISWFSSLSTQLVTLTSKFVSFYLPFIMNQHELFNLKKKSRIIITLWFVLFSLITDVGLGILFWLI